MGIHFAMSEDGEGTWQRAPLRRLGEYIPSGVGYLIWNYWILYHTNMIYGTFHSLVQAWNRGANLAKWTMKVEVKKRLRCSYARARIQMLQSDDEVVFCN